MIEIILKWLIPTILTALSTYVVASLRNNSKNNKSMRSSMRIMLRSQIVGKVEQYIRSGYLPDYARSCLEDLYTEYSNLGGNHGIDQLVAQAYKLPPINKEEESR